MELTDGRLTEKQLNYIDGQIAVNANQYLKYKSYYTGDNYEIKSAPAKLTPPDNRTPGAFARKIIDSMKGYARSAGKVTYSTKGSYIDTLKKIFDDNDEELLHGEIYTDVLMSGYGYSIFRVDEDAKKIKIYRAVPGTCYAVYDNTLAHKMIAFVRMTTVNDGVEVAHQIRETYYADRFIEEKGTVGNWIITEDKEHPFGDVPAVEYTASMDKLPLFYAVLALINEHDKITSSSYSDERERFANSMLLLGKKIDTARKDANGNTDLENINIRRVIDDIFRDGTITDVNSAVGFLNKPSRGPDVAEQADRFERLIYDLSMVINLNDPRAMTAVSGIAYKLRLLPMEFKAADIDCYFDRGIQRAITLIGNAKEIHGGVPETVTINHKRNIPSDIESIATVAGNLKGILSDETILSLFPADLVPDVKAELKKIDDQMPELPEDPIIPEVVVKNANDTPEA